jgi:hypothetical protein
MNDYIALLVLKFRFFILSWMCKISNLFKHKNGDDMFDGELLVTRKGEIEIVLRKHPSSVRVFFDDECVIVPCNPHHHDHFHWHVKNLHQNHSHDHRHDHCNHEDKFVLIIKWDVKNMRVIKWVVRY